MTRFTKKSILIKELLNKCRNAFFDGFYLEVIFLIHVIIEERLRSTVLKIKPDLGGRNKIPGCVKKLSVYIENKQYATHLAFSKKTLKEIKNWKKKRDALIHDFEKNSDIVQDSEKLKDIATEGFDLLRIFSASVMRWKRKNHNLTGRCT